MNNNNRNNNRRRGRSNSRGGQGGGNQSNRVDSRARGNAPQMLEKYRKLAHDASLNDDRVQTEYYLQFADHYFRVIADGKTQRDEQRPRQQGTADFDDADYAAEDEQPFAAQARGGGERDRHDNRDRQRSAQLDDEGLEGEEGDQSDDENPFTRPDKPAAKSAAKSAERERGPRQSGSGQSERAQSGRGRRDAPRAPERVRPDDGESEPEGALDPGLLPPAIARASRDDEDAPRRKLSRPRRGEPREDPRDDGGDEALEAVN